MEPSYNKIKTITTEEFCSLTPSLTSKERKEVPPAPPTLPKEEEEEEEFPSGLPVVGKVSILVS